MLVNIVSTGRYFGNFASPLGRTAIMESGAIGLPALLARRGALLLFAALAEL